MGRFDSFSDFSELRKSPRLWANFINELNRSDAGQSSTGNTVTNVTVNTGSGSASSSSGGGGPASPAAQSLTPPVEVIDSSGLLTRGDLVVYRGSTLKKADNTDEAANFAVLEKQGTKVFLTQAASLMLLRITPDRGTNADGLLLLGTSGRATDLETDILDSNGDFQNNAVVRQQVGYRLGLQGTPPAGFVYASLWLLPGFG